MLVIKTKGNISMNIQMISAVLEDSPIKIKSLVNEGFDINLCSSIVMPPLHRAAFYGKINAFQTLLELDACPDLKDKDNRTALYWAKKHNHDKIIAILKTDD